MNRRIFILSLLALTAKLFSPVVFGQEKMIEPNLNKITEGKEWQILNRQVSLVESNNRKFVRFDERPNAGIAILRNYQFKNGTIELDVRGRNVLQKSFIGIAFHILDETTYDAIYFRPFNFRNSVPERRGHAVQYISSPEYPWQKLRKEFPGKYEQPIQPAPDSDAWFHVRVVVDGSKITVYVNNSEFPCLTVLKLNKRSSGKIGFWIGNNSDGDFADLRISPN